MIPTPHHLYVGMCGFWLVWYNVPYQSFRYHEAVSAPWFPYRITLILVCVDLGCMVQLWQCTNHSDIMKASSICFMIPIPLHLNFGSVNLGCMVQCTNHSMQISWFIESVSASWFPYHITSLWYVWIWVVWYNVPTISWSSICFMIPIPHHLNFGSVDLGCMVQCTNHEGYHEAVSVSWFPYHITCVDLGCHSVGFYQWYHEAILPKPWTDFA